MRIAKFLATSSLLVATGASAQFSPALVTDAQVALYQQGIEMGCRNAGRAKGDPPARVDAVCGCLISELRKAVPKAAWQQAFFQSTARRPDLEAQAMAPYTSKVSHCQAARLDPSLARP
jgi:hypothetical protein